jgi:3-isopropylmalate dehydrogenase
MMLRHSLKLEAEAASIEKAVEETISEGARTTDIGGRLTTRQMADEILKRLHLYATDPQGVLRKAATT